MKKIIARNLDLTKEYFLIDKKYIPVLDGGGAVCANCGKLIANIATVKDSNGKRFDIGLDCLETLMLNNQILKGVILDFDKLKKDLPKVKRGLKHIQEFIALNPTIDRFDIEKSTYSDWFTYYFFTNGKTVWNDGIKLKDVDCELYFNTLKANFPNLEINIIQ